jgi:carboxypeptidase PM20D1
MSTRSITLPGPVRSIALLLLLIVATLGFNTIRFSSVQVTEEPAAALALNENAVLQRLTEVIRHKTISYQDPERWDDRPFLELHEYLRQQFPAVHSAAELETIGQYSLLYRIPGKDASLKPILLMAHMDVVPIEDNTRGQWLQPPFSGTVIDGELFGRGTIDDKASMVAILEAAEWLLSSTFTPDRDIYLFFGHDEELGGNRGAIPAVRKLEADGISFDFVLDEGMGIAEGLGNLEVPAAIIGIAEKGTVTPDSYRSRRPLIPAHFRQRSGSSGAGSGGSAGQPHPRPAGRCHRTHVRHPDPGNGMEQTPAFRQPLVDGASAGAGA